MKKQTLTNEQLLVLLDLVQGRQDYLKKLQDPSPSTKKSIEDLKQLQRTLWSIGMDQLTPGDPE